jgi:hypothetical protein
VADVGGVPYVAWSESFSALRVKRFDGVSWSQVGGGLNFQPIGLPGFSSVASLGGVPYVAWGEKQYTSSRPQTYVKRLEPDFLQQAALATDTQAQLVARVRDYGAAYPIAFQYGPGGGLGTQTAVQQTAGTGSDTVVQQVAALTPQTAYSWRVIGVDSLGPTAVGATQTFTTGPQNGPGSTGPAGSTGPLGSTGPAGPGGAAGRDAVVSCKLLGAAAARKRRRRSSRVVCTVMLIAAHPRSRIAAKLVRDRTVYATGRARARRGSRTLLLLARRPLNRGRYTLVITITTPQGTLPARLSATVS